MSQPSGFHNQVFEIGVKHDSMLAQVQQNPIEKA